MIDHLIKKIKTDLGKTSLLKPSKEILGKIMKYSFPGNIRELINTIATLYIYANDKGVISDINRLP